MAAVLVTYCGEEGRRGKATPVDVWLGFTGPNCVTRPPLAAGETVKMNV